MPDPVMLDLVATCPADTEAVLMDELKTLGITDISPGYMAVYFKADEKQFYRCHLRLATASNILKVIKDVPAQSPVILNMKASRIDWLKVFNPEIGRASCRERVYVLV